MLRACVSFTEIYVYFTAEKLTAPPGFMFKIKPKDLPYEEICC